MNFQNKLQIFRCNSSAIFITFSLKGYSERGFGMGFGFSFFFYGNTKFHLGKAPLQITSGLGAGCRKLHQLQTTPVLGLSTGTAQSVQPLAQLGRYQATKTQCLQQWLSQHVNICTPSTPKIKLVRSQTRL